jgi:hypothetical protein
MINKSLYGEGVFTLHPILDYRECQALIGRAEAVGFEMASIITARGAQVVEEVRNNDRVIIDDEALAAALWERVHEYVPRSLMGREVMGLNERFRFYRYVPGQRFRWHSDGCFQRENGERSLLTFMIYLNEGYTGGHTRFEWTQVSGRTGMALVFGHGLIHEGAVLETGRKYVIRSDVMYGPVGKFSPGW